MNTEEKPSPLPTLPEDNIKVYTPEETPKSKMPVIGGILMVIAAVLFIVTAGSLYYTAALIDNLEGDGTLEGIIEERLEDEYVPVKDVKVSIEDTNFTTYTDNSGHYQFDDVPSDIYKIRYEKPGYKIVRLKVIIYSDAALKNNNLKHNNYSFPNEVLGLKVFERSREYINRVFENGTIEGEILNETGLPMSNVNISYFLAGEADNIPLGMINQIETDSSGQFELNLTPGLYELNVSYPGYIEVHYEVLVSPKNVSIVNIMLLSGDGISEHKYEKISTVTGKITTEDGEPIPDVIVKIEGTNLSAATDASGEYVLENIPDGPRILSISKVGYSFFTANIFVFGNWTCDQNLEYLGEKYYDRSDIQGRLYTCTILYIIIAVVLFAGSVMALKRKNFGLALFASLLGTAGTVNILLWYHGCATAIICVVAMACVFFSRREFS